MSNFYFYRPAFPDGLPSRENELRDHPLNGCRFGGTGQWLDVVGAPVLSQRQTAWADTLRRPARASVYQLTSANRATPDREITVADFGGEPVLVKEWSPRETNWFWLLDPRNMPGSLNEAQAGYESWLRVTQASETRWVMDEVTAHNQGVYFFYTGGTDGRYVRIEKDGTTELGTYEGAIPHIMEAAFHRQHNVKFESQAQAFWRISVAAGRKFLIDIVTEF